MKDDLQKSDSCGLKSERKKILTSSTCSLACLSTNLGAFCPMVVHLPSEKSILPYFSGPRGVAILDCDSHSQAGSTTRPLITLSLSLDPFPPSSSLSFSSSGFSGYSSIFYRLCVVLSSDFLFPWEGSWLLSCSPLCLFFFSQVHMASRLINLPVVALFFATVLKCALMKTQAHTLTFP